VCLPVGISTYLCDLSLDMLTRWIMISYRQHKCDALDETLKEITMDSIIIRTTPDNRPAVFMLDSLDTTRGIISMWAANGEEPRTVDLSVYRSTKPVGEILESEIVEKYRQRFQPAGGVVVRSRLYKVSPQKGGPEVVPKEQPSKHNVLESEGNKAAQKRESSPEAVKEHAQQAQPNPLADIEKILLVERITHAFATSFAKSMSEAMSEVLKK